MDDVIQRLLKGETVRMGGQQLKELTSFIQEADEETYAAFGSLASTVNKDYSLGLYVHYDVFLKDRGSV
jgi:hypothetical protein